MGRSDRLGGPVPPAPPSGYGPVDIAAGRDGNLWFTESRPNRVTKVTVSGVFTQYPIPTADSTPQGIVAGPDGNVWFTEANANKVAKIVGLA